MAFHEVRFPIALSFGSSGGPERRTEVVALANGFEERNTPWEHSRRRYDAGVGLRSLADIDVLIAFFEARRGRLHGFRWKDWTDWTSSAPSKEPSSADQRLGMGDGEKLSFQLGKTYASGGASYVRPIVKPVAGTVSVAVGGEDLPPEHWQVDHQTGAVEFTAPPPEGAEVTAGFTFDVPVRFDVDRLQISVSSFAAGEIPSVPVVEIRL
ncbi:phage distal tail protein, Rcc01695 family [Roseitranquillus sediminis]|uniref:phage distal tail protein, Rcc01695 family n=1 Tax=Roseitranquillus sediminis TaxID=2809051 RepID=UPI001D0C254F|nr:DUF2460 domain-containing protein [Roseitranquillus sediminis]MBM9595204.1 DUF2460 domain-containing protein [Roseitranquillus sediminis]